MAGRITIKIGHVLIEAELNDSATAASIAGALPIKARANRWGGEIYCPIPVTAALEPDSRQVLRAGELGYWPAGRAFCIFFGPTPVSEADEIRAASDVTIIGRVDGDLSQLWNVQDDDAVVINAK